MYSSLFHSYDGKERETHRTRQYRDTTPGKHLRQIRSTSTSTSQFPKSRMLETLSDAPQDTHTYPHHPLSHTLITHTETDEEWVISILTHPMASSLNCPSASPALHLHITLSPALAEVVPQPDKPHQNRPLEKGLKSDTETEIRSHWKQVTFSQGVNSQ